jgi:hypothetical protein
VVGHEDEYPNEELTRKSRGFWDMEAEIPEKNGNFPDQSA